MCGIIISRSRVLYPFIGHRGTEYSEVSRDGMTYGHWRLPIQTREGDGWNQPIQCANGKLLLFNGEIYNYPKSYNNDVEYLKDCLELTGTHGLIRESNKWDGMWAICIVEEGNKIIAFTDPLGKKQLYVNSMGEICSEIRPIVINWKDWDLTYKSQCLKWGYSASNRTPWNHVKRIIPNRVVTICNNLKIQTSNEDYFSWDMGSRTWSCRDPYVLRYLLEQSVKRRVLTSNEPIACLLSGGLDSSIISFLSHQISSGVGFYYVDNGEGKYALEMGQIMGVDVAQIYPNYSDNLETIFRWNETPIDLGSVIPQHDLIEAVKETVILTGDGADELFGGYRRAKEYDSQYSDIFDELPYYHLPRLDRASMRFTKELRSPFLSHNVVRFALNCPRELRIDKKILKDAFRGDIPNSIIERPKLPLKARGVDWTGRAYRNKIHDLFYSMEWLAGE